MKAFASVLVVLLFSSLAAFGARSVVFEVTPADAKSVTIAEEKHGMNVVVITLNDDAFHRFEAVVYSNFGAELSLAIRGEAIYRFKIDETVVSMGRRDPENTFRLLRLGVGSESRALLIKAFLETGKTGTGKTGSGKTGS